MKRWVVLGTLLAANAVLYGLAFQGAEPQATSPYEVVAYNDLGMHCMNQDFSEICILPPANTFRATVIYRGGDDPQIVTTGVTLKYDIPGNTESVSKTNFWDFASLLFGVELPSNVGLFGNGLAGKMTLTTDKDFVARAIPVTPQTDIGVFDPYQLARVKVIKNGLTVATTKAVIPVSWEIHCDNCHTTPGISVATDILTKHDTLHGTKLVDEKPVLCAKCHSDNALGAPGTIGVPAFSSAMHTSHAPRVQAYKGLAQCYLCHPGGVTKCLRDVHRAKGMTCQSCHVSMQAVGSTTRRPWIDEPRCGGCHKVAGHQYEQANKLYRDSKGHNGVKCVVCHDSPHTVAQATTYRDRIQLLRLQGTPGTLSKCTVCHKTQPTEPFNHTLTN